MMRIISVATNAELVFSINSHFQCLLSMTVDVALALATQLCCTPQILDGALDFAYCHVAKS